MNKKSTIIFKNPPVIKSSFSTVGKKEGEGPLSSYFDLIVEDSKFGEQSWEKAESKFIKYSIDHAIVKADLSKDDIDFIFSGDLLNQCVGTNYALRELNIPYFGIYGACSTMAESLILSSLIIDAGYASNVIAVTSSHFCSAERQFRFPLEYGGTRPETSQWTVTGSGAVVLSDKGPGTEIKSVTVGKIVDKGIKDMNNMGAAMAPAAADTILNFLNDTNTEITDYDLVLTGDLGKFGNSMLCRILKENGINHLDNLKDCGMMIYDSKLQDVHSGGSGPGCSASVLSGYVIKELNKKNLNRVLFIATGALMNTVLAQQGESIPSIAHLVELKNS